MPSQFIQDILDRLKKLEGAQPTVELDRHGHVITLLEQEVRKLNVSKEYRRRIEDLEARWASLVLHRERPLHRTHLSADYVVDTAGNGTHLHLRDAVADAILALVDKFIWVKFSVSASNMDLTGMNANQNIYIMAGDREQVRITAAAGEDIFVQSGTGGETAGGLHFSNIGFVPDDSGGKGIYANTGASGEIKTLEFNHCRINGGYFARQTGLNSLGAMALMIDNTIGTCKGFYEVVGASATLGPDRLLAIDNDLIMTEWWAAGSVKAPPGTTYVQGGRYDISTQLDIADGTDNFHWRGFFMLYSGANAAFFSGTGTLAVDDWTWTDIQFQVSNAAGKFCKLGIFANAGNGLYIHGIHGFGIAGLTMDNPLIFIEVGDSSDAWSTAFVSDIYAPEWPTLFEGHGTPLGDTHNLLSTTHTDTTAAAVARGALVIGVGATPKWERVTIGADGSLLSSDGTDATWQTNILIAGYLAIGTASAPEETTAGDFTFIEAFGEHISLEHTVSGEADHVLNIDVFAAGFEGTHGIELNYNTGAIAAGSDNEGMLIKLDEDNATGGHFAGYRMLATTSGDIGEIDALSCGIGIGPVLQLSGTFGDPDLAEVLAVDKLTDFVNPATNVNVFVANNDTVTVGKTTTFQTMEWILSTGASGAGIKPKYEFSSGAGPTTFTEFVPTDGTEGMKHSGILAWDDADIAALGTWTAISGNFLIRITRQRTNLTTKPVSSFLQCSATQSYSWDLNAKLTVANIFLHNASGTEVAELDITGNADFAGYLHAGSASDPTNTTAGDITGVRGFLTTSLRIGSTTAPTVPLDVTGAAKISTTLVVTGATTLTGGIATSTTLTGTLTTTVNVLVQGGTITLGVADTTPGVLVVQGNTTSSDQGGEIQLHLAQDHTSFDSWDIAAIEDDLNFNLSTGELMMELTAEGVLRLPTVGITGGLLLGGDVQLYRVTANVLRTPDSLIVDGATTLTGALTISANMVASASNFPTWNDTGITGAELEDLSDGGATTLHTHAGGSGTLTTVKEGGVQVGGADIVTLDFGPGFDVAETPDTEVNITLDFSEVAGHDLFTDFVAGEHLVVGSINHDLLLNFATNEHFTEASITTIAADLSIAGTLSVDDIIEKSSAAGVTIDSVVLKDGQVDGLDAGNHRHAGSGSSGLAVAATNVTYAPAVLGDWDGGVDPGDVDDGLDELAERVKDLETVTIFLEPHWLNGTAGLTSTYPVATLTSVQACAMNAAIPEDFVSVVVAELVLIPDATETIQIDFSIESNGEGDLATANRATNANRTLAVTTGVLTEWNITSFLPTIAAGDYLGLHIASDTSNIRVVGVRLTYLRT